MLALTVGLVIVAFVTLILVHYCMQKNTQALSNRFRTNLSEQEAIEIYCHKLSVIQSAGSEPRRARNARMKVECAALAVKYRVSPKTVMDVWNHKTWIMATSHLWEQD